MGAAFLDLSSAQRDKHHAVRTATHMRPRPPTQTWCTYSDTSLQLYWIPLSSSFCKSFKDAFVQFVLKRIQKKTTTLFSQQKFCLSACLCAVTLKLTTVEEHTLLSHNINFADRWSDHRITMQCSAGKRGKCWLTCLHGRLLYINKYFKRRFFSSD